MEEDQFEDLITEAHGWALLGLHEEAIVLIASLPEDRWFSAPVLAVRLIYCTDAGLWETGDELVKVFTPGCPDWQREAAGRFLLAHAVWLLNTGDHPGANGKLVLLSRLWPEGRTEALGHPGLRDLF